MKRRRSARIAVALVSAMVLAVTGYGWNAYRSLSAGLTRSSALDDVASGSLFHSGGETAGSDAENILLMGLDSRLDQNGDPLPQAVLSELHAGDSSNGGYNTNVLMVLHIPSAGEGKASVISIPRDDYVELPGRPDGVTKEKIKEGYGLAKDAAERKLRAQGITDRQVLERQGREAGRRQTITTVESLLDIRIDHFVEVTLVGFYDLAEALGSIQVCLLGPTQDSYSGARFSRGYQKLDAAQALAFVRQRRDYVHPALDFTDLDRERRQQAFLASAAYQLKTAGTFADPSRVAALIGVAQRDVVIDSGLDLLGMAARLPEMLDGNTSMTTLPVRSFGKVNGEDVNLVDAGQIRAAVRKTIGPDDSATDPATDSASPAELPPATVDVVNAGGRDGLAASTLGELARRGLTPGTARTQRRLSALTLVRYAPDTADTASALARLLGPQVEAQPDPSVPAGHTVLVLGRGFSPPADLGTETTTDGQDQPAPDSTGSPPPAGTPTNTIHVEGIPCVK